MSHPFPIVYVYLYLFSNLFFIYFSLCLTLFLLLTLSFRHSTFAPTFYFFTIPSSILLHATHAFHPPPSPPLPLSNFLSISFPFPPLLAIPPPPTDERLQVDWQWPLSDEHSIMMVNSAQPAKGGGGCTSIPFESIYPHEQKLWCTHQPEKSDTIPLFLLYPFLLCGPPHYPYFFFYF